MTGFTGYLIISTLCLIFSYCIFKIIPRRESEFGHQRIFLLVSLMLSIILPATGIRLEIVSLPTAIGESGRNLPPTLLNTSATISESKGYFETIAGFIPYIYIVVTSTLILLMISQLLKIFRLYIISEKKRTGKLLILRSQRIKSPFSFFSWVFIPRNITEEEEIDSIIIHESIHARNYHSIDNLITGLATALMWFNPVLWLIRNSLQLVHEYMADEGALKTGIEKSRYQMLLVNQAAEERLMYIPSTFNNNLKKRMIMMTKSSNKGRGRFRIISLFPVSVILIIAVSILNGLFMEDAKAQEQKKKNEKFKEVTVTGYGMEPDTMNYIVDGVRMNSIKDLNPDSIESINVLKTDRTIVIRTKSFAKKQAPKAQTGIKTGSDNVYYILDEIPISKADMNNLDPSDIKSLEVIKGKDRIKKYTDGNYDGVIIITSKK